MGKFALLALILILVVHSYRGERPRYIGDNKEFDEYLTTLGVIVNETRQYAQVYLDLVVKYRDDNSLESYPQEQREYKALHQRGEYILSQAKGFDILYQEAKLSVQREAENYQHNQDFKRIFVLLLEQISVGNEMVYKTVHFVTMNNEVIQIVLQIGSESISERRKQILAESVIEKQRLAWEVSEEVNQAKRKFDDLNYERLKIFNKLKEVQNGNQQRLKTSPKLPAASFFKPETLNETSVQMRMV